jgi:plasmid replication initiation protein
MDNQVILHSDDIESIDIKNWVTKSNDLIESTYKLSLQEQRILLVLASKVQPSDDVLKTYRFRIKDFVEIIGKNVDGFYSYLKGTVIGLQTKVLTIKKDGKERVYNWLITSIYEENEGFITLQFHPELKGFFLQLKEKFTSYQLQNIIRLNSVYSIRIYELLKQYEKLRKRKLKISELRDLLGIEPTKYKQYGHFKSRILLAAQKEINNNTDIHFTFTEFKTGRKVTGIEFEIKSQGNKVRIDNEEKADELDPIQLSLLDSSDEENNPLKKELENLGVPGDKLDWVLNEFPEDQVIRNVQYVHTRKKNIKYLSSYTIKAIQNDYAQTKDTTNHKTRTEILPDYFEQEKIGDSLEEQQNYYYKKRGSQEEFEKSLLKVKELQITLYRDLKKEPDEIVKEAVSKTIQECLEKDIHKRKALGLELQPISNFIDNDIKEIYKNLLEDMLIKK